MAKVLGLGGVFYKCKDVEAYREWWSNHMGVDVTDWGTLEWASDGQGQTMMSPFADDTLYLAPSNHRFMINLRVDDVPTMIDKARAGGATVLGDIEDTEFGVFGWFLDPEGIKIELWQQPKPKI